MPQFDWSGFDRLAARLGAWRADVPQEVARQVYIEGELIMTQAKRLTPVDTGTLRASGRVRQRFSGDDIVVELSFGGPARQYAIYVHEDMEAYHRVGQAKFLEQPVLEMSDQFFDAVVVATRDALTKDV